MQTKNEHVYIEVKCPECRKIKMQRRSSYNRGLNLLCRSCGSRSGMLKRGRIGRKIDSQSGYILVMVHPNDPMRIMTHKDGWCLEHRIIMARYIGRPLLKSEFVHHKNGIKSDNRIENLELISRQDHSILNKLCAHCELRKEIRLLKWQIGELQVKVRRGVYAE